MQQDRYTDMQLPWPDISVASLLCYDRVHLYKPVEGCGITDEWIENVTPNIVSAFSNEVAVILGKEILWVCFEPSLIGVVPDDIRRNVMALFIQLNERVRANGGVGIAVDDGANPICKAKMIASEPGGKIDFDELFEPEIEEQTGAAVGNGPFGGRNNAIRRRRSHHQQWMNVMYANIICDLQGRMSNMENLLIKEFALQKDRNKRLQAACNQAPMALVARWMVRQSLVNPGEATAGGVERQKQQAIIASMDMLV